MSNLIIAQMTPFVLSVYYRTNMCTCCTQLSAANTPPCFSPPPLFSKTRAPDGSCILTNSADNVLRVYNLPSEIYSYNWDSLPEMVNKDILPSCLCRTSSWLRDCWQHTENFRQESCPQIYVWIYFSG